MIFSKILRLDRDPCLPVGRPKVADSRKLFHKAFRAYGKKGVFSVFSYQLFESSRGIGGTGHVKRIEGKTIVTDWGAEFERNPLTGNNIVIPPAGNFMKGERVDAFILTHAHMDHAYYAARFAAEHPKAVVYVSRAAFAALEILLGDALRIAEYEREASWKAHRSVLEMGFTEVQLKQFLRSKQIEKVDEPCWYRPWKGWELGFHSAGHDTGAMSAYVITPKGKTVYLTGDASAQNQEIREGVLLPNEEFLGDFFEHPHLTMITEATNGNRNICESDHVPGDVVASVNRHCEHITEDLIRTVKAVERRGGQVLTPVFMKNRASRNIVALTSAGFRVHVDGGAREMAPLEIPNFRELVANGQVVLFEKGTKDDPSGYRTGDMHRTLLAQGKDPCGIKFSPVIAPSATLEKGYVVGHAVDMLEDPRNAVIFTGHLFENSAGKRLYETKKGETIALDVWDSETKTAQKVTVTVRADIYYFDRTGHDYQETLLERIRLVKPETLIIHHAEPAAYEALASLVARLPNPPRRIFRGGQDEIELAA
ncbi:MAG: MBL fold metallo-hydrolase [bacterium]|nr:MBL fold metallo-hydrolase [bacterium]